MPWVGVIALELVAAARSGAPEAVGGGVAALTGGVGALVYVRRRATSSDARLATEVESGRFIWAAQVSLDGFAGTLRLSPDVEFRYDPDRWSAKHGVTPRSWDAGTRLSVTRSRRDITGIRIQEILLTPTHGNPSRFNAYLAHGTLPSPALSDGP